MFGVEHEAELLASAPAPRSAFDQRRDVAGRKVGRPGGYESFPGRDPAGIDPFGAYAKTDRLALVPRV
ncbi:MAG: hypothetical protein F4W94_06190 [Acidimicrobiia bacterium]|nr:hypothetical protein [bacterium]MYD41308.1 hypothetical protein [Acidimicrobiia bacterium]